MAGVAQNHSVLLRGLSMLLVRRPGQLSCRILPRCKFHTGSIVSAEFDPEDLSRNRRKKEDRFKKEFLKYNDIVYPPTKEGEDPRPAEICHVREDIKSPQSKMWPAAVMVRGMSIDEAVKQLSFNKKKAHHIVKEVLLEAQEKAVKDFNVEYRSNLWVADSFAVQSRIEKNYRFHARFRLGKINERYSNYYVRLREGKPPKHYYPPPKNGNELLEEYVKEQRSRRIAFSL